MYGKGYDWTQQYSVSSGDIVGSLPVGMQTRGARDVPYWPAQNMYVYKEVWVHPVARWLWLTRDIAGPAPARPAPTDDRTAGACREKPIAGAAWDGAVRYSAGIELVENFGAPMWRTGEGWTFTEVLRIGAAKGAPEYDFGQISGFAVLSDRRIVVHQPISGSLWSVDLPF